MALPLSSLLPCGVNAQLPNKLALSNSKGIETACELNIKVSELVLKVVLEATQAIESCEYKKFDALVKNFGCQMTALENFQLLQTPEKRAKLREEASHVQAAVQDRLSRIPKFLNNPPLKEIAEAGLEGLYNRVGLDLKISPELFRLVRFRLLCLINDNKPHPAIAEREQPYTNIDAMRSYTSLSKNVLKALIEDIQVEEGKTACSFIRREALAQVQKEVFRSSLVLRCLGEEFEEKGLGKVVRLPSLYNTEASIRAVDGIILLKNKLQFCGKRIQEALPIKFFLHMPEERILAQEDIAAIPESQPLVVMEGYIKDSSLLVEKIHKIGLLSIVNANVAKTHHCIKDPEAELDLENYKKLDDDHMITSKVFEIDHIFCSSMKEET